MINPNVYMKRLMRRITRDSQQASHRIAAAEERLLSGLCFSNAGALIKATARASRFGSRGVDMNNRETNGATVVDFDTIAQRVMTVQDVSAYLRVHPSTVYRLLKRNELPAFRVGSDWRFNVEAIDRWRSQMEAGAHVLDK
jgi:excisionase family DNA binding protein